MSNPSITLAAPAKQGWLARLPLATQIYGGFGALLILLMALAGLSINSEKTNDRTIDNLEILRANDIDLTEIAEGVRDMGLIALAFTNSASDVDQARFLEKLAQMRENVSQLAEAEERAELDAKLAAYGDTFDALAARKFAMLAIRGDRLDVVGPQMRAKVTDIREQAFDADALEIASVAGAANERLLLARLYVNKYADTGNEAAAEEASGYFDELPERLDAVDNAIAAQPAGARQKASLLAEAETLLAEYISAFADLRVEKAAADAAYAELIRENDVLVATVDEFADRSGDAAEAASQAAELRSAANLQRMVAFSVFALLLGIAAAVLIARSISSVIGMITKGMERLAEGDDASVPDGAGRKDPVGKMLQAMTTLQAIVRQSFRQGQMIEDLPVPVMMATPETGLPIGYLNKAARDALIASGAPVPAAGDADIDIKLSALHERFSGDAARLLSPAQLPWSTTIELGDQVFAVSVSALYDRDGDYTGPMLVWQNETEKARIAADFESSVKGSVDALITQLGTMAAESQSMAGAADEATQRSSIVVSAATQTSSNVETVAAAAEQMAASINEIAQQVAQSSGIAQKAVSEAHSTNETVERLAQAAERIGEVVGLIADIAGQTNLLALNATIEAARAGEAGKGFAVVANEVKSLAEQTSKATEDIGNQISTMQNITGSAVTAIRDIGSTIEEIDNIASSISAAVEEQSSATGEISRNVQEAATGTQQVTQEIDGVRAVAEKTGEAASGLLTNAQDLQSRAGELGRQVDDFLRSIGSRAA